MVLPPPTPDLNSSSSSSHYRHTSKSDLLWFSKRLLSRIDHRLVAEIVLSGVLWLSLLLVEKIRPMTNWSSSSWSFSPLFTLCHALSFSSSSSSLLQSFVSIVIMVNFLALLLFLILSKGTQSNQSSLCGMMAHNGILLLNGCCSGGSRTWTTAL